MRSVLTSIIVTIVFGFSFAQLEPVNVQIMVQPPYSPHFEDYIIYENKVVLVLTGKPNPTMEPYQVYFKGVLEGTNDVMIKTEEGYKPSGPVEVPAGGTITIQGTEIDFFSSEHLTLSGVDENDLLFGDGLPEGYYQICIRAFDFDTDEPASPDEPLGCSPEFGVFHIDPPQIMLPLDGATITPTESQNIAFTWTIPVNSPLNTEYILTLTELLEGQDPNDAAEALTYPPLFETSVSVNSYVYSMADPVLEEGRTYVGRVRAYDPLNAVVFRNDGFSEVCVFHYGDDSFEPDIPVVSVDTGFSVTDIVDIIPPVYNFPPAFQSTSICGKIHYKYPEYGDARDDEGVLGMNTVTVKLIVDYTLIDPNSGTSIQSTGLNEYNHGTSVPSGHILATTTTDQEGTYCFEYLSNIELGHIGDYIIPGVKIYNSQPIYRVLRVEIEAPHTNYYEQYSRNAYIVDFGETAEDVDFIFNIEQVNLDVNLKWEIEGWVSLFGQTFLYQNDAVDVPVYLLRKSLFSSPISAFPKYDGYPNDHEYATPHFDIPSGHKIVASTTTTKDNAGNSIASFKQLVLHHNPGFIYYVYVVPAENNINNFDPVGPILLDFYDIDQTAVGGTILVPRVDNTPSGDYEPIGNNPVLLKTNVMLQHNYPKIEGTIMLEAGNTVVPLDGVDLLLDEIYMADNSDHLEYNKPNAHWQEKHLANNLSNNACYCTQHVYRLDRSSGDGKYEFPDLAILHNTENVKTNVVALKAIKPGYVLAEQEGRLNDKTLLTTKKLSFGQKQDVLIIMKHGAKVKGRVADAESGDWIEDAKITIIPDGVTFQTNQWGYFNDLPAAKLQGQEQLLVIEKTGYISDTFSVIIDQEQTDLGVFEIYQAKRRLKVIVRDPNGQKPLYTSVKIRDVEKENGSPMAELTDAKGEASFIFSNAADEFLVAVGDLASHGHWEIAYTNIAIPVQKEFTILNIKLKPASCISGMVYAGSSNDIRIHDAIVKQEQYSISLPSGMNLSVPIDTMMDQSYGGFYGLYNIPLSVIPRKYVAAKAGSQYVGDKWMTVLNEPKGKFDCVKHDFHLTIYNDMDITSLMGIPIYVTALESINATSAKIRGGFSGISSNSHFTIDNNATLDFDDEITIIAQPLQPGDTIPRAKPSSFPILTKENNLSDISAEGIDAILERDNGIAVFPEQQGSLNGVIKGKVKLKNTYFNVSDASFPDFYVLSPDNKVDIPVFRGFLNTAGTNWPNDGDYHVGNSLGEDAKFSIYSFSNATASHENSKIMNGKLVLNTILHTDIKGIAPRDIKLNIGDVVINKNSIDEINGSNPINIQIDKWNLTSSDWTFNNEGLIIDDGSIEAMGLSVKTENFEIKQNELDGSTATFDFQDVKLAGIKKLNVVSQNAGFSYVMVDSGSNSWAYQITIPKNGNSYGAYLDNLPAMAMQDKLAFRFVNLKSDGNSQYPLFSSESILLHDLVAFKPEPNSSMQVTAQSFALRGDLLLKYPWVPYVKTNIGFTNNNGLLEFGMYATELIKFTENKLKTDLEITEFTHQLLVAEGSVEEPGAFPETNVILTHNPQKVQIDIKEDETIRVSDANYFDEVIGEMHIDKNLDEWSIFWFEGYPRGMNGVSDNDPEKLTFTVNGVVTATEQEIGVKKVPTSFGGLSFVYDLPKSELKGNCTIDMNVSGLGVNGGVEAVVGSNGWYFQATGSANVPNYGAMSLFALFGDYNGNIDMLQCGGFECLPIQFQNKVKGFLISGSITKQFVNVGYGLPTSEPLLEVAFGVDVSLAARFFTSFEDVGTEIGLSVKLYGDAFANATLPGLIASANSRALIGLAATYNTSTHFFAVNGQTGLSLSTSLKQWNPPPVGEIELGPFDVGVCATISGDSNGGFEYDLKIEKCDECN